MNTVHELWTSYYEAVMPAVATNSVQYTECRRAFYAGVYALLTELKAIGEADIPEEDGVMFLARTDDECNAFYRDVKAGKK